MKQLSLLCFILLIAPLLADPSLTREWRSRDGSRSFRGTYLRSDADQVVIKKGSEEFTFTISKLHPDDQGFIRRFENAKGEAYLRAPKPIFDTLHFGDSYRQVLDKLRASEVVVSHVGNGIFDTMAGISGKFKTQHTIGGLQCFLHFYWGAGTRTEMGTMKALTGLELRTTSVTAAEVPTSLMASWSELVQLFQIIHGAPRFAAPTYPTAAQIAAGQGAPTITHRWDLAGGAITLGPALDSKDGSYYLYVTITQD